MDTEEDFELFSDELSSQVPVRKLKRLKKGGAVEVNRLPSESLDLVEENLFPSESPDFEEADGRGFQEPRSGSRSSRDGFDEEDELSSGFDGLGVEDNGLDFGTKRMLDFDSLPEEEDHNSENLDLDMEIEKSKGDSTLKESGAGKPDEKKEKKRKKRVKDHVDDILESTAPPKRVTEKERTKRLAALRAESQRLLRETRDATFKPAPLVQKPISSLLHKIRQRKLEVIKKTIVIDDDIYTKETTVELDSEDEIVIEGEENDSVEELARDGGIASQHISDEPLVNDILGNTGNHSGSVGTPPEMAADEVPVPKQAFQPSLDDNEDLLSAPQTSDSKDEMSDEGPNSPVEVPTPSAPAMNFDSSLPDDISSSDEEESDKENEDPSPRGRGLVDMSSPKGDPAKAFLDDEAEEEDDSDNDRLCLGDDDNEEDEDSEDLEEVEDIIATAFEEKPSDIERRMEHHQELLNRLDAAETEKMLQRWGLKKPKETLLDEEVDGESEDERGENDMEESDDEASDNLPATSSVRVSIKKLREMIPQMFTDKDDIYISDDEETEKSLVKLRLSEKADKQAKFVSPVEDPRSKELFNQIKQVNKIPRPQKRARKSSSYSTMLLNVGKGNSLPETSFIGRGSKGSLPSIPKKGSNMGRSFIFERETSNGKNKILAAEDTSDKVQRETRAAKPASAKFSGSQATSSTQNKNPAAETSSRIPLLDILRRSSLQLKTSHCTRDSAIDRHESIFAAFKLEKKTVK